MPFDVQRVAKEPNTPRSPPPWKENQQFGNQETASQPLGAISCLQSAGRKLQLMNQKVVLSTQHSENSVFPAPLKVLSTLPVKYQLATLSMVPCEGTITFPAEQHAGCLCTSVAALFLEFSLLRNDRRPRLSSEFVAWSAATFGVGAIAQMRFWRRSRSIDRRVSTCRRGRRCPSASKDKKTRPRIVRISPVVGWPYCAEVTPHIGQALRPKTLSIVPR